MVQLVYWGLQRYDHVEEARTARIALVERSRELLVGPWRRFGHVHENYDPITGRGCNVQDSDPFYHWGALLAFVSHLERHLSRTRHSIPSIERSAIE